MKLENFIVGLSHGKESWLKMGKVKTKLKHQTSRKKIFNRHGSSGQELHNQVFEECKPSRVYGFIFVFYKVFLRTVWENLWQIG